MIKKRTKRAVLGMLLFLSCAACKKPAVIYENSGQQEAYKDRAEEVSAETEGTEAGSAEADTKRDAVSLYVYVCGHVQNPGVYELSEGNRIVDAIEAAGGMTENAAKEYLNLAQLVTDGQRIEVPSPEEAKVLEEAAKEAAGGLVNLNQASKEQLMTLTGIGESKAKEILSYREQHGGFSKVEDLMNIPGIKTGVFQKIKDQITV